MSLVDRIAMGGAVWGCITFFLGFLFGVLVGLAHANKRKATQ